MKIVMFTNTFTPHVGGVARSVQQFADEYRQLGHDVLVVAPEFAGIPKSEPDVIRMPAIQKFNGSDFSVPMPVPGRLRGKLDAFGPDIVHSHHPFLLGDAALRVASRRDIPVVFTHHTQYEKYTHYVPGDSELMQRFVIELAVGYCNLCDAVIAPSKTIANRLHQQGVTTEIVEIPTGVDVRHFSRGEGEHFRKQNGISQSTFVIGHVGRLAPEKGLGFLSECIAEFLAAHPDSVFLVAGGGPSERAMREAMSRHGVQDRFVLLGTLTRNELADVYAAMDVFAFASQSETQGMVLTEAMAASTPVVAVDAPGVREIMRDGENGLMIPREEKAAFVEALTRLHDAADEQYEGWRQGALHTAEKFSMRNTATQAITLYERLIRQERDADRPVDRWDNAMRRIEEEWKIWANMVEAAGQAILGSDQKVS
jgi:glycosyltransferase involved in cell wall biosynthesis